MNCVASTYDTSGKLVGCAEQDLNSLISVQLYTIFALGAGLYVYKSFTAENWADIVINIGWGCVSTYTHTKRAFTKHVLPFINLGLQRVSDTCSHFELLREEGSDDDSAVSPDDYYSIRIIKDGVETKLYSSVFSFVQDLDEHFTEPSCPRRNRTDSDVDGDVISVNLSEGNGSEEPIQSEAEAEAEAEAEVEEDISEVIKRIETHTMQLDFILSEVPTTYDIMNAADANLNQNKNKEGIHVMKYDGFPRDSNGIHFYDREFVPVDHRMMEIVLHHEGNEYDLNLASPDNFHVAGNKLLDPAFLKWFMLKNHGVRMMTNCNGSDGAKYEYTIKCVDNAAVLHTLHPHNYLHVSESGFDVHDSGLV